MEPLVVAARPAVGPASPSGQVLPTRMGAAGPVLRTRLAVARQFVGTRGAEGASASGQCPSTQADGILLARHELPDDRGAGDLAGDEKATAGLRVGEQDELVLADA